ncbi:DNAj domain (prokaryotic heat shock protein)-related [Anaeramoeba flamelloides]|uniref:DNAj domain (Prokaryotic heat shock protein)-related n=1 Tax=Anaeramoeba flamelloides TaxID=1746091 RepID=A0ABQ8XP96_9EUKA|nr:DNAj domain (prokaryotic heat shock protein)-related [Anaeramoeba flamelloides]
MSQYSFSPDLLSQDLTHIKKDFQGITSFRKRLKKLQKIRPSSITGLNSYDLNKDYLKNKNKSTLPKRIEIRRDCITDLVLLCSKPKKSIERGLATFFKKYYLLKNISNYSREWLVFGPDNENRQKMNVTHKEPKKKTNMKSNPKKKQKQKLKKNKKQKLQLKHKLQTKKQKKKKKKLLGGEPLTFRLHSKKRNLKRGKNTKKKSTTSRSFLNYEQYSTSRKRSHNNLSEKSNCFYDLDVNNEKIPHKKTNQKSDLSYIGSQTSPKKRKPKNTKIKKSYLKHQKRALKKKRLNQVSCKKFSSSKLKQKRNKIIKKKIVLCKRFHLFQQKQQVKDKQQEEQEQEQEQQQEQELEQQQEQEQEKEELQIQLQEPLELFTSPIQDYGIRYPSFKFDTDQLENNEEDFDMEFITNTRNSFFPFLDDIFEDSDSNLVLFQQDELNDTHSGFF